MKLFCGLRWHGSFASKLRDAGGIGAINGFKKPTTLIHRDKLYKEDTHVSLFTRIGLVINMFLLTLFQTIEP
jgi:hypothetical protein